MTPASLIGLFFAAAFLLVSCVLAGMGSSSFTVWAAIPVLASFLFMALGCLLLFTTLSGYGDGVAWKWTGAAFILWMASGVLGDLVRRLRR